MASVAPTLALGVLRQMIGPLWAWFPHLSKRTAEAEVLTGSRRHSPHAVDVLGRQAV